MGAVPFPSPLPLMLLPTRVRCERLGKAFALVVMHG
jgi:hypothetical protein